MVDYVMEFTAPPDWREFISLRLEATCQKGNKYQYQISIALWPYTYRVANLKRTYTGIPTIDIFRRFFISIHDEWIMVITDRDFVKLGHWDLFKQFVLGEMGI